MTRQERLSFIIAVILVLAITVAAVVIAAYSTASADTCDPAYTAQCCACEPSEAAEPAPLPRLYLPTVQRSMPPMSAESTPLQPVPTVTPEAPVTGDVTQEDAQ
jgi:flagellar basal body-associated protein FliL